MTFFVFLTQYLGSKIQLDSSIWSLTTSTRFTCFYSESNGTEKGMFKCP